MPTKIDTIAIDLKKHEANPGFAMSRAFRSDAARIIFIGTDAELERRAAQAGLEVEVLPAGSSVPAYATEVLPISEPKQSNEIDMFAMLLARVQAGEPIHIQLPLSGTVAMMHISTIERLKREAGMAVSVIYS